MIAPTRKASLRSRMAAAVVDSVLGAGVAILVWGIYLIVLNAPIIRTFKGDSISLTPSGVVVVVTFGYFLYAVVFGLLLPSTPGRMLLGLRLMSRDITPPRRRQILISSLGIVPIGLFLSLLLVGGEFENVVLYAIVHSAATVILIGRGFSIAITHKKQTPLDVLADTVVISGSRKQKSPAPPEFKRISPNPYFFGTAIRSREFFFGREKDLEFIRANLERPNAVLLLWGPRRMGKTSLFKHICNRQATASFNDIIPAYIDAQHFVIGIINSNADLYQELARAVAEASDVETGFDELDFGPESAATSLKHVIDQAIAGESKKIAFFIDEFTLLEKRIEEGPLTEDVPLFLSALVNGNPNISIILTGSREADPEAMPKIWLLLENLAPDMCQQIGVLGEQDCRRLITEPVAGKLEIDRGVVDLIFRLTGGHPFFTQFICYQMVMYANRNKRAYIGGDDLEAFVLPTLERMPDETLAIWGQTLSQDQRWVLSVMAEMLDEANDTVTEDALWHCLQKPEYELAMTKRCLNTALDRLVRLDILLEEPRGEYAFNIDLLRHWIRKKHPVRSLYAGRDRAAHEPKSQTTETEEDGAANE